MLMEAVATGAGSVATPPACGLFDPRSGPGPAVGAGMAADMHDGVQPPPGFVPFVVAAFRAHRHISNVLTHISGGRWKEIDQALRAILDPHADIHALTPLARNIVELMCADRGVTGRIMKPFYQQLFVSALGEEAASRVIGDITGLFIDLEAKAFGVRIPDAPHRRVRQ